MAELTAAGYIGKTQNEYYAEGIQLLLDIDINWDTDASTPDGMMTLSNAELFGNFDETLGFANASKDRNQATGQQLNSIGALTGSERSDGTASTVVLNIAGVNGTLVPQSSIVASTSTGLEWSTDAPATLLGASVPVAVNASCTTLGANAASIGTITEIKTPIGGWQTSTNPGVAEVGKTQQTDSSYRLEQAASVARPGSNQIGNIAGELFAVEGTTNVRIYENFTNAVDPNGLPAKSIAMYVIGGADADNARAIFIKRSPGSLMWPDPGATSVTVPVIDPEYSWNTQDITFNRPADLPIIVVVTVVDDSSLPGTIVQEIKDNLIAYAAGGEPAAECGFNNAGFDIAEDVTYSRMYTPVNQVIGSYGNSYISVLTINGGTANITIAFNEISQWLDGNITVNIV